MNTKKPPDALNPKEQLSEHEEITRKGYLLTVWAKRETGGINDKTFFQHECQTNKNFFDDSQPMYIPGWSGTIRIYPPSFLTEEERINGYWTVKDPGLRRQPPLSERVYQIRFKEADPENIEYQEKSGDINEPWKTITYSQIIAEITDLINAQGITFVLPE